MASEWREERCGDCGATVERRWVTRTHKVGVKVPDGFRVERHRSGSSWSTIAGRTADVSMCLCDAA